MAELQHFPEQEPAANLPPHVKGKPFVKFTKVFRHHKVVDGQSAVEEVEEQYYYPIDVAPNIEAIENLRKEGGEVIGFGNFPKEAPYGAIAQHLMRNTGLQFKNKNSPAYKRFREEIMADLEAEGKLPAAPKGKPAPAKKDEAGEDEDAPPASKGGEPKK